MSGDWMKIEVSLPEKPEVWQIAGMVNIDPDAVVGKLLKVWRWFDAHTETGNAAGVTLSLVDHVAGVTGFGEAMSLCGWLHQDGALLVLPNFDRHNGKTAKNRALTAKRVASHKTKTNAKGNDASVTSALPREEKRREEKKEQKAATDVALPEVPDWVDREAWDGFVSMRRRERHPLTPRAAKLIFAELDKLRSDGHAPQSVLDQSTRNGWRDVFPLKGGGKKPADDGIPDFMRGAL